ncbi:MAG: alpha/beta fold hydrolase [Bacteroidetes bacterium]|nr:alpha/beta fold hydrolase [Bacteroidota bacterium]
MELAYRSYGSGQALLILHGLFGQSDNWNTLAKRFADAGFEVYALDQRNHGLSPHDNVFTYGAMADDLYEFIQKHRLQNPIVLGHSMGGKTAMYFALKYQQALSKLIVADMSPRAYPPHHDEVLQALQAVNFSTISTRKEAEQILNEYISDFGTKQFLLKNIYWKEPSTQMSWRFNLEAIVKNYSSILAAVPQESSKVRSLFIKGGKSNYITDLDIPEIEKRFPHYQLSIIPHSGHWVHAEQPDIFYKEVLSFITESEA